MPYTSINSQGGLLPLDLLDRVGAGQASRQGPTDFGLPSGARLTDRIQSAYSDARMYWDVYQRRLETSSESRTTLTRLAWIVPLLELLGFEHLKVHRSALQIGEDSFTISHTYGNFADYVPVHIVGNDLSVDKRASRRRSPHSAVQEYLNRSDSVWGLVTNGDHLRLLRSTSRTAIPTYIEFDLAGIMESNQYTEFVLLYRLLHASRFPATEGSWGDSIIEYYYEQGVNEGDRVRDRLREGVEQALKILGTGLLKHPESEILREQLRSGRLSHNQFYQQLLRTVYRLLFLMVAEERRLISVPSATDEQRRIYSRYYSIGQLRDRSEVYFAEDKTSDLWQGLGSTFRIFADSANAASIGVAPLGTQLFGIGACQDVELASCGNYPVLAAIRNLSMFDTDIGARRVNYAGLDVEELGSIYESLLDYRPYVDLETRIFDLRAGSERRSTGSYYTSPDLVAELIENTLVPAMEEKLEAAGGASEARQQALLNLRIVDPASGSGHFLLAAARRIGHMLAKIRSNEEEPSPAERRHAIRDVIRECVYAVDKNPLAVDLCKLAMWLESHDSNLPLGFLDHHIKNGDSLVGVTDLSAVYQGIPDDAFKPSATDDRSYARSLRDRNRRERNQATLGESNLNGITSEIAEQFAELGHLEEQTPEDVKAKAEIYGELANEEATYDLARALDLWTFAFFCSMQKPSADQPRSFTPTTADIRTAVSNPGAMDQRLVGIATAAAIESGYFHWAIEFPDVIKNGGFDVVLGNPPFLGGLKISTEFGRSYLDFIIFNYAPAGGTADLCAYFSRAAFSLLTNSGRAGIVAVNTIGQGDTREAGLRPIINGGGTITNVKRFVKWSGTANVEVNLLSFAKGKDYPNIVLDGQRVESISSRLDAEPEVEPKRLIARRSQAFQGVILHGMRFVIDKSEVENLMSASARNRECLMPFINGKDINNHPKLEAARWAINFHDWSLDTARKFPELLEIVESRAAKDTEKLKREKGADEWWKYARSRPALYSAIHGQKRVLVRAATSELHMMAFLPPGMVYSNALYVFAFDDNYHFGLLQSNVHEVWVRRNASTLRTDLRYTPTDCFETFAFPTDPEYQLTENAANTARQYETHRAQTLIDRDFGLTKAYNLFNSADCLDSDIAELRKFHAQMDREILACYNWEDIEPEHGFYENDRGRVQYTVSISARREIIRRLIELNHEISDQEN